MLHKSFFPLKMNLNLLFHLLDEFLFKNFIPKYKISREQLLKTGLHRDKSPGPAWNSDEVVVRWSASSHDVSSVGEWAPKSAKRRKSQCFFIWGRFTLTIITLMKGNYILLNQIINTLKIN